MDKNDFLFFTGFFGSIFVVGCLFLVSSAFDASWWHDPNAASWAQAIGTFIALLLTGGLFFGQGWLESRRIKSRIRLIAEAGYGVFEDLVDGSDQALANLMSEHRSLLWDDLSQRLSSLPIEKLHDDMALQALLSLTVIFRDAKRLHRNFLQPNGEEVVARLTALQGQVGQLLRDHL